jgi:flagellar biosynthesis/type III secretory pathway chaperone
MIALEERTRTAVAGEHVRLMQALGRELERAMSAIARNDLLEFEDSITTQQALSCALSELARELRAPVVCGPDTDSLDEDLRQQIRNAVAELQNLNLRYSILLQQSSRSAAQMAALFHSVRGQFQEDAGARSKHQTWSCQM